MNFAKKMQFGLLGAVTAVAMASTAQAAPEVIDTLVLYQPEVSQTTNGRDINARIVSYIEYTNQAYINSGVNLRLRLVAAKPINKRWTYVNSENLGALRGDREVASMREQYGADVVSVINLRQPMQGGYVCGIGYVPPGSSNGQLASNAESLAFNLVGVDCGYSTFAHEVGHNMALGHSAAQDTGGGIWTWARGHGVYGSFSTIMAYPQSYGTSNQLQRFSNPSQRACENQPCGVARNAANGADAVGNLNALATQLSAFRPTKVGGGGTPGPTDPTDPTDPTTPTGYRATFEQNNDGWQTYMGGTVSRVQTAYEGNYSLESTRRTSWYSGPGLNVRGLLQPGRDYSFKAQVGLSGYGSSTNNELWAYIVDDRGARWEKLISRSGNAGYWNALEGNFRLNTSGNVSQLRLHVFGPSSTYTLYLDNVTITPAG